jgi:hypothetical protein
LSQARIFFRSAFITTITSTAAACCAQPGPSGLIRISLLLDAKYLAMLLPLEYRPPSAAESPDRAG